MNKDYLNSKLKKAKSLSLKQSVITLMLFLFVAVAFGQSTITITTTSNSPIWNVAISNPSVQPDWNANGPGIALVESESNTPTFNLSPNNLNGDVIVTTSGTASSFAGIKLLQADNPVGLQITVIDVADLNNLEDLRLTDNLLTSIDVSQNLNLKHLNLKRNDLAILDVSSNVNLEELYLDANTNLAALDISNNPKLRVLSAAALLNISSLDISNNPQLTSLNLAFVPLTSASIDDILIKLDGFGKSNGSLDLQILQEV